MNKNRIKQSATSREAGQGIVEYLLIIALVGLAVVVIINLMQPAIGAVFSDFVDRANTAPPNLVGFTRIPPTPTATPDPGATLTITIIGNGSVTQSPDPPLPGNTVTLTAVPDPGWVFTGWGDDLSGTDNPGFIYLDTDKTVSANFVEETYILNVTLFGAGSVTVSPDQPSYNSGQTISLSAIPDTGSLFMTWGGDIGGSTNPYILVMDSDKTVEAYFQVGCYDLTVTDSPNDAWGNVAVSPGPNCNGTQYSHGTVVSLQANPAAGYVFDSWGGALTGSSNPASLTMNGDRSVTANYTELLYTLTTSVAGNGSITISPNQSTYGWGETATLTAVPATGAVFTGWSGDASGTTNPVTITFDGNKSVTANFQSTCYTLSSAASPTAGGTVTYSPTSSPGCAAGRYVYGENVTLTAAPATGYSFTNWTGGASGTNPVTTITILNNTSVTANFQANCHTLTALPNPTAGGMITPNPAPNCVTNNTSGWTYGSNVTLTANPNSGYMFSSWTGDTTSTSGNTATVLVNSNKSVTANFVVNNLVACEYQETGGIIVIEAEHYFAVNNPGTGSASGSSWLPVTSPSGYVGSYAMQASPNSGVNVGDGSNGPRLDYHINFQTTGDYYIWVRGYGPSGSDDSLHVGFGSPHTTGAMGLTEFGTNYEWNRWDVPINVSATGLRTLNVWMREDGMIFDRIYLVRTNVSSGLSNGSTAVGPAESNAPAGCPNPVIVPQTVTDNFESGGWNGGNNWGGDWSNSNDAIVTGGGTPYGGSYHMRLRDNGWIERSANLSSFAGSGATISFYWKGTTPLAGNEEWNVEISSNGGSSWNLLFRVEDNNVSSTYSQFSATLNSSYLVSGFRIRFSGVNSNDNDDYFYVDNIVISAN